MLQCGLRDEVNWFRWGIHKMTAEIIDQKSVTDFFPIMS